MTDIFNNETISQEQTSQENGNIAAIQNQADIFVEKLLEIKREDGTPKYDNLEDALSALKHSQEFIPQLQQENAELRKRAEEAQTLKETLERLQQGKNMIEEKPQDQTGHKGGLSEEAAAKLIDERLKAKEQEAVLIGNVKSVQDTLIQKHGSKEKAQEFVVTKANELGMSTEDLKALSARSPAAALALLGEAVKSIPSAHTSSIRVPYTQPNDDIKAPEKSLISGPGATTKNQTEYARRIRENVIKQLENGTRKFHGS